MVILVGTTVKMVMLRKVIAGEKSSARFVYHFCFGKSTSIQAISETVSSKFELLESVGRKGRFSWKWLKNSVYSFR